MIRKQYSYAEGNVRTFREQELLEMEARHLQSFVRAVVDDCGELEF